jgi:glycosyltransferase involved in cell wall biosynthesis
MRFSVVIPTLNRTDFLREALASLQACAPPPDEIIVVDGDPARSAEATVAEARRQADSIPLRYLTSEVGVTRQKNAGLTASSGDVILFLDDDVEVDRRVFAVLSEVYRDPELVGATGNVMEPPSYRLGDQRSPFRRWLFGGGEEGSFTRFGYPRYVLDASQPRDVEFMPGGFSSARRHAAVEVRFDEALSGVALGEDEDFAYRLSRLGRIRYLPKAIVHHRKLGFGSYDSRAFNRAIVINRAYLFRKNFRPTVLARAQFALFLLVLLGHRVVNADWPGARGVIEGSTKAWRGALAHHLDPHDRSPRPHPSRR